jgi:hypothetical protein
MHVLVVHIGLIISTLPMWTSMIGKATQTWLIVIARTADENWSTPFP